MDDGQQDQYEERLKEVFESFDASGAGSLCPEELSDLCQALHLEDSTPTLLHALLQNQDPLTGRVSPYTWACSLRLEGNGLKQGGTTTKCPIRNAIVFTHAQNLGTLDILSLS